MESRSPETLSISVLILECPLQRQSEPAGPRGSSHGKVQPESEGRGNSWWKGCCAELDTEDPKERSLIFSLLCTKM